MDILKKYYFDEKLFEKLRKDYINGNFTEKDNTIKGKIEPPQLHHFVDLRNIDNETKQKYIEVGKTTIKNNQLGYAIVNGGMSTRFGSVVKGLVNVFDDKTFLEIKIEQVKKICYKYNAEVKIFIMNSFATEKQTIEYIEKNNYFGLNKNNIYFFNQFIFKRLNPDGSYFEIDGEPLLSYYGPGHGDFIYAFNKSGHLDKFINSGGKHLWYSNVDNLGAVIDELILGYHVSENSEMTVEVAQKYQGDAGGVPAIVNNRIQLVEGFGFPAEFDQTTIPVFNTATYIFQTTSLKKEVQLPWYIVKKKVKGNEVIQFERLTGDLSVFLRSNYVIIDREERFFPIKTQQDLENLRDKLKKKFG
jgi:UTP--glucose-1-phosphate uridylyltransferase